MKKYIVFILLVTSSLAILHADESAEIHISASCSDSRNISNGELFSTDSKREKFTITINSRGLNLSKDAVQDNTGGYVDIPEDRHYFKTDDNVYRLYGSVERSNEDNINQFTSKIHSESKKIINTEELYSLKNSQNLKLIQKINLEYRNNKTNIIDVHFDENLFDKEYQKCEEQISKSVKEFYFQSISLVVFLLVMTYLLIRKFKRR